MKKPRILGLIVARKNSKGLKNKHLINIKKKTCIEWSFEAANKSKMLDYRLLSTDSKKIINLSKKYNIHSPFVRPSKLSKDKTSIYEVIKHSYNWLNKRNNKFDIIVLLQASSPLRKAKHIDKAIKFFLKNQRFIKSLISGYKVNNKNFWILRKKNKFINFVFKQKKLLRRQEYDELYLPNGAIYIARLNNLKSFYTNKTVMFEMSEHDSVDIDTIEDLRLARKNISN